MTGTHEGFNLEFFGPQHDSEPDKLLKEHEELDCPHRIVEEKAFSVQKDVLPIRCSGERYQIHFATVGEPEFKELFLHGEVH